MSPQDIQETVKSSSKVLPRGSGTKTALSSAKEGQTVLELSGLSGVIEYDPGEFVFVAWAGTKLLEVEQMLAQHGQYLPFDPPFVQAGATLGGTVAAGLSGPMRQRYGGVRDFILGVQLVDGAGNLIRGGGKVVKNAAGFDLPKLMVGSLGRLGILTEVAFKVFPFPKATATLKVTYPTLNEALEALYRLAGSHFEFYTLDLEPPPAPTLVLRLGGFAEALPARLERVMGFLGVQPRERTLVLEGQIESNYWQYRNQLDLGHNPPGAEPKGFLVKVAIQPKWIPKLEESLAPLTVMRQYLSAGNLLYMGCLGLSDGLQKLDLALKGLGLSGLVISGTVDNPYIGVNSSHVFGAKVQAALDPNHKFSTP